MNPSDAYDVIVVGAGPAGSSCASILARNGLRVALLDRAHFPRDKICGDCVNPRCWKFFRFLGVEAAIKATGCTILSSIEIISVDGEVLSFPVPSHADRPFVALPRRVLDEILRQQAVADGAMFFEDCRVQEVAVNGDIEVIAARGSDCLRFRGRTVVGADGRNSLIARRFGRPSQFSNGPRDRRVGIQWLCSDDGWSDGVVRMYLLRDGYVGAVAVAGSMVNLAMVIDMEESAPRQDFFMSRLRSSLVGNSALAGRCGSLMPVSPLLSASPITPRATHSVHHRVVLAGDARRSVEPFTGEGVYFALRDGCEAAVRILKEGGRAVATPRDAHSTVWVNHLFSPVLRSPHVGRVLHRSVRSLGWLGRVGIRTVFS